MQARSLLDAGRRAHATALLREALSICREAGTQFCGPKVTGALSLAVEDPAEREALLIEGAQMLARGAVGHNHLWFHRDAIEVQLSAGNADSAMRHAAALEDYTRAEPLPWSSLFASRGRCLARVLRGDLSDELLDELKRVRAELLSAGFETLRRGRRRRAERHAAKPGLEFALARGSWTHIDAALHLRPLSRPGG